MIRLGDVNFNVGADTRGLQNSVKEMRNFESAVNRAANSNQRAVKSFQDTKRAADGLENSLRNIASGLVVIQGPLGGFATRLSSLIAVMRRADVGVAAFVGGVSAASIAVVRLGQNVLTAGKQINSFTSQFKAVTGSQQLAEEQMRKVIQIARESGQRIEDLGQSYAKFLAAASGTGLTIEQVDKIFMDMAKAASVLNLNTEQSMGIFRALEQILSKGTVQAEELRGQLGDRLAGAVQTAARAMGVTTQKLQEMMKAGEIASTDFLPKFSAELAKTLNLMDGKKVDTYTASVNNMSNAWFQLRGALDAQFQLTEKVKASYEGMTEVLDTIRVNLDNIKLTIVAVTGAFLGMVAPVIIGGIVKVIKLTYDLAKAVSILNTTMMLNPMGALAGLIIRVGLAIAGALTALYQFRDEIRIINGELATLGDYLSVAMQEIETNIGPALDAFSTAWGGVKNVVLDVFRYIAKNNQMTWADVGNEAWQGANFVMDVFYNLNTAIPTILAAIPKAVGLAAAHALNEEITKIESFLNDVKQKIWQWKRDLFGNDNARDAVGWLGDTIGDFLGIENLGDRITAASEFKPIEMPKIDTKELKDSLDADVDEINSIMSRQNKIMEESARKLEEYRDRANRLALDRVYNDPSRRLDVYTPPDKLQGFDAIQREAQITDKQVKAQQRRQQAIEAVNDAIANTREEIEALGESSNAFEALTEKFKREKEVEKYAKALRKAGLDTEFVTKKTEELMNVLEKRDELKKVREAFTEFRNSFADGLDTAWSSIIDGAFEGKNALESLRDVAKDVAKDIIQTWTRLAILNPIKNWLFGMNEPTLQGGFIGNAMKVMPGLFKQSQASASASSASSTASMIARAYQDSSRGLDVIRPGFAANQNNNALLSLIRRSEGTAGLGGYNTTLAYGKFAGGATNLTGMTLNQVDALQTRMLAHPENSFNSSAAGAYQIVQKTLRGLREQLGLSGNELYDEGMQDRLAGHLIDRRGRSAIGLRNEWEGLRNVDSKEIFEAYDESINSVKDFGKQLTQSNSAATGWTNNIKEFNNVASSSVQSLGNLGGGFDKFGNALSSASQQITSGASSGGGGFLGILGKLFGGIFGGFTPNTTLTNFLGYTPGMKFAKGGAFGSSGLVSSPTMFSYGGGNLGEMGESGEEAVMPLARDSTGSLGVVARLPRQSGGDVIVNIFSPEGSKVETQQRQDSQGNEVLDIFLNQATQKIAGDISKGGTAMNKAIEGRYSLKSASGLK